MDQESVLLTPKEAAEFLGMTTGMLGYFRRAKVIPAIYFSRKTIRYDKQSLVEFMRFRTVEAVNGARQPRG